MTDKGTPASVWVGRLLSALVILVLVADTIIDVWVPGMIGAEMEKTGFPPALAPALGIVTFVCAVLYAIPRTAVIGAILVTGFLGGAICTHFRIGEIGSPPQLICLLLGVMTWGGLYLRDARIRALLLGQP
jgi:hypothetical protein